MFARLAGGLNISQLGADPLRPDIFVEIDYMGSSGGAVPHDHRPDPDALEALRKKFDDHGINLHIDAGIPGFDLSADALAGGEVLPHQSVLVVDLGSFGAEAFGHVMDAIEDIKATHFNRNRCNVFHYCVWVHGLWSVRNPETMLLEDSTTTGIAQEVCTDDFIVSLWVHAGGSGSPVEQAGTFMHELGHTLHLEHGGFQLLNCKPNYRSVMNYRYQLDGVDVSCCGGVPAPFCCDALGDGSEDMNGVVLNIDYSGEMLPTLNEACLNEAAGICGGVGIDWNQQFGTQSCSIPQGCGAQCVEFNISADPSIGACTDCRSLLDGQILQSFDDWEHLWFDFKHCPSKENCGRPSKAGNGLDDDLDGIVDEDCLVENCTNDIDDDGDCRIDAMDPDCGGGEGGGGGSVTYIIPESLRCR